jgi:hypothetical protein
LNSNYPSQPPRVPPPPPPTDTGGGRRHGLFYGGCAVAALLALMAILVLGALVFLVVLGSSGGGENPSGSAPSPQPSPSPQQTEPQYLNDIIEEEQIGPFTLDAWDWDTADATASGAMDGVKLRYLHSDGTILAVTVWEFSSTDGASEDLDQTVSDAPQGYEIVDEFPVESNEGELLGQGVQVSGETEIVMWTNEELSIFVETPSTADYLEEFYQNAPY